MNFLFNALQNQQQGVGMFYNGPSEVLHAPSTPIVSTTSHRDPSNTGKAFRQGTGDSSAKQHMERHGYQSGKNQHHRTHIGGFGQHGTIADNPSNIGSATKSTNGLMIPTDNHYPPGFINLNEGEVEEDTHVLHRIHQAISHPDDPTHPLFRYTHDGFRQFATGEEWDERQEWARNNLNEETLNGAHHLHLLNPNGHPTMDDYRDEEDTERTSELLTNMKHHGNNNNNDNDMDISDEED